jgi:uncharacterized protein DUF6292
MLAVMERGADTTHALSRGLAGYVRAIAGALGLPEEGTSFEISDTATAYVALARHSGRHPGRDLMLVWSERTGWAVAVETDPGTPSAVIAYFGGQDPVPEAYAVAAFVDDVLAGRRSQDRRPAFATVNNRARLAGRLAGYVL